MLLLSPIEIHREDFRREPLAIKAAPTDLPPVRTEKGTAIVAVRVGQSLRIRSVCLRDVDLHRKFLIELERFLIRFAHRAVVGLTIRRKHDMLPVR